LTGSKETIIRLDPIAAYDRIAPEYRQIRERRQAYLISVERLILRQIPQESRTMLDVGSGDGVRARRLAEAAGIQNLVLLEPSAGMRRLWPPDVRGLPTTAEALDSIGETFDVITCLWNVLGHISREAQRVHVLRQFRRLLSPKGMVFLDVNHRFNMREYGVARTLGRIARDSLMPDERHGDVVAQWKAGGATYAAMGHVFTDREITRLMGKAGLQIKERISVDYRSGDVRRSKFSGNLLYCLA
jgi:2-polyprenyl-3-methyl-5-hydroxy-6-metoxy-1,4-benzoquinol methylase